MEFIGPIITGALAFLGTLITCLATSNKTIYRIEQLEKKVDRHNNFAERMPVVEEQIKVINHRLEDLEKGGSKK